MHTPRRSRTRFTVLLLSLALAVSACSVAPTQEAPLPKKTVRIQFLSTLPESLTYYDQGFGDFMRDSKEVPLTVLSVNDLGAQSFVASLETLNIEAAPSSSTLRPSTQAEVDRLIAGLGQRTDIDAMVVLGPGAAPSERFMKGMAILTKIGLLGIDKFSMVFTMPSIEIYSRESTKPCARLNPVRTKKIPAIYSKWSTDMTNGPPEALHRDMQALVAAELPQTIRDGVSGGARRISNCLRPVSQ